MKLAVVMVIGLVACGDGAKTSPDAALTGTAKSHILYVNTEGVTVTPGNDDATANVSLVAMTTGTLTGFLVSNAARQSKIDALVTELQTIVAPYGVFIVTARPAAGPYDMLVVTDSAPSAIGLNPGIGAITTTSCNSTPSVISFQFALPPTDANATHEMARNAIAMFGIDNGIALSKQAGDCMCLADMACNTLTAACTIGGAGTPIDPNGACGMTGTTMDEAALFVQAFGSR